MLMRKFSFVALLSACLISSAVAQDKVARGLIKAKEHAILASEIGAVVVKTPKRTGDSFKKGDLLIGFDCRLLASQKDKVAAEMKAAKARLDNAKELERMRSIGKLDVTLAKADLDKTRAELKMADFNVNRCNVTAPFDGKVVGLLVNRFESVDLRRSLIEIVSSSDLEVEVIAPAQWLNSVSVAQQARMDIDELATSVDVEVVAVGGAVDPVSQTVVIRGRIIEAPDGLLPGMSGAFRP